VKYFAILKDSLREALDSKVLIVLLVISTLVTAGVAALSFKPLSAEQTMSMFFPNQFQPALIPLVINSHKPEKILAQEANLFGDGGPKMKAPRGSYTLKEVNLLRGEQDAPESDYELIVLQNNWRHGSPRPANLADDDAAIDAVREIFQDAVDLGFMHVEVALADNQEQNAPKRFQVIAKGTPRTHRIWATEMQIFGSPFPGSAKPLAAVINDLAQLVLKIGSWVAVLAGVVITSFFIPNMLRKGTVDLLLAKPLHRWALLTYKYLGGLAFILVVNAYSIGGIWLVIGLRSGLWANAALLLIFSLTFFFAILYAVSAFVGVVTRSAIVSIVVTIVAWAAFAAIGSIHHGLDFVGRLEKEMEKKGRAIPAEDRWGEGKFALAARILNTITPHTEDLNKLNDMLVFTSFMTGDLSDVPKFDTSSTSWWASLLVSGVWIIIFLGVASLWFTYKDY
jgi:ABC-type transport system involved in multi-copper enzyme maturation permease subunit